jgi:hypothetical protein
LRLLHARLRLLDARLRLPVGLLWRLLTLLWLPVALWLPRVLLAWLLPIPLLNGLLRLGGLTAVTWRWIAAAWGLIHEP